MKKLLLSFLIINSLLITLTGCGGVSQKDCDASKAENESLKYQIEEIKYGAERLFAESKTHIENKEYGKARSTIALLKEKHPTFLQAKYSDTDITFKDQRFLNALIKDNNIDSNNDGQISEREASTCKQLYLEDREIRNMDEIRYFTALKTLFCYNNQLTSLDVKNNTALTYLDCGENQLTSIDLSNNTVLDYLHCDNNPNLTKIWLATGQTITDFRKDSGTIIRYK